MKKRVCLVFLLSFLFVLSACNKKEKGEEKNVEPLPVEAELFLYEGTQDADIIAVDEEGYLYTATCITQIDTEQEINASEYVYEPFIQLFKVYDLEGNCIKEVEVGVGNGDISFLTAEGELLYCIVMKSMLEIYRPTLYTIHTKTWEVTELYGFDDYVYINNFAHVGDYFYVLGQLKEVPDKNYELHSSVVSYTYAGECISRIKVGEEHPQEECLPIDFPIDIISTKKNTLMIYHYNEKQGFGFLEFYPQEQVLEEVENKRSSTSLGYFTECKDGFLFYKENGIFYGTTDGLETELSKTNVMIWRDPTYQRGFLFYLNTMNEPIVERIGIDDLIKKNTPIRLIIDEDGKQMPFECGYQMKKNILGTEAFALKVLAGDSDFDMIYLNSRNYSSYNIKKNGAFYALNEVEGVKEYLDACFPYVKEAATNEDGDIWMIPVYLNIPALQYHREYCETNGVDLSTMDYQQFLTLVEEVEKEAPEQGSVSTYIMMEELMYQYLSVYDSFDADVFRMYAKQIKQLTERMGELYFDGFVLSKWSKKNQVHFIYEYENINDVLDSIQVKKIKDLDAIGVVGLPKISENLGNVGSVIFLAVNANSENLEATLAYISDFCKYMMTKQNSFLLADESTYTTEPYIKQWYDVYKEEASIFFPMDKEVYWHTFWDYIDGEIELEEMVKEIERKRKIYVGE